MTDPVSTDPTSTAANSGLIEDLIDLFGSPSAVFARRATASPVAPFFTVMVLLLALMFVNQGVMRNIMDTQMAKGMQAQMKGQTMSAEQQEAAAKMQQSVSKFAFVGIAVATPITLLIFALVIWLVGKIFGSQLSYGAALTVGTFAWVPKVVEQVLLSVQGMMLDTSTFTEPAQVSLGLARFLPSGTSTMVVALAGRIDPIILWSTVLLALGYAAAGKVEPKKAWIAAGVLWVCGVLPALMSGMRAG